MRATVFGNGTRYHRFAFMLSLSVTIAVMGLSLGSAAVVIGAMLIAPLMMPVMRFSAALVLGLSRLMARSATVVVFASVGAVAYSWVLARLLPHQQLTAEVLSRTSPDFRDLCVALAAGAAGAYALTRDDVSAALPGVAVAVALVPPLAAIGMALEASRSDLAEGAALLYLANLVAIALAGALVFLVRGLVPKRRLADVTPRVAAGFVGVVAATLVIAIPLTARSLAVADHFRDSETVNQQVATWLGPNSSLDIQSVSVDGNAVTVDLAGAAVPPDTDTLTSALSSALGRTIDVNVRWQQRSDLSITAEGRLVVSKAKLESIIEQWLGDAAEGGVTDRVVSVSANDSDLTVELAGPQTPPPVNSLANLLEERLGIKRTVKVSWTEQVVTESGRAAEDVQLLAGARAAADVWARNTGGLDVLDTTYAHGTVTVDLAGAKPPASTASIVRAIRKATTATTRVRIRFVERRILH